MHQCPHCGATLADAPAPPPTCPDCGEPIAPDDRAIRIRTYEPALRTAALLRPASATGAAGGLTFAPCEGGWAVTGCTGSPDAIDIPETYRGMPVLEVRRCAFRGMPIRSVQLPATLTALHEQAFAQCLSLTSVSGGAGLKWIGAKCFFHCIRLESLHLDSVPEADISAFAGCFSLGIANETVHRRADHP